MSSGPRCPARPQRTATDRSGNDLTRSPSGKLGFGAPAAARAIASLIGADMMRFEGVAIDLAGVRHDDDNDGFTGGFDTDPVDAQLCQDIEGDGCDDCVSGAFDPFDDGTNTDGDPLCAAGDDDDDNDGCADPIDPFPRAPRAD